MNEDPPPSEVQAKVLAGRLLSLGAGRASAALDQFSSWLLSGFGATFALLFGNIDPVSKHLRVESLQSAIWLFLAVLVLGVISRLLAAIIGAGAEAASQAEPMGRELAEQEIEVNVKTVFREVESATFWPARQAVASSFRKVDKGDFAAAGRLHARLAQLQGYLVFVEVALAVVIVGVLACGLAV